MLRTLPFLLLLLTTEAILVRITNIYHRVYLTPHLAVAQDPGPDYWVFENGEVSLQNRTLFLGVGDSDKLTLDGSAATKWSYDTAMMTLYTNRTGSPQCLTLNGTSASVSSLNASSITTSQRILVASVPISHNVTLVEKLRAHLTKLQEELGSAKQKYGVVAAQIEQLDKNSSAMSKKMMEAEREYNNIITRMGESVRGFNKTLRDVQSDTSTAISTINAKQVEIETVTIPFIKRSLNDIPNKEEMFSKKLKSSVMDDMLEETLTPVNESLANCLNRHRVLPAAPYDWLTLATTLLSLLYFADLIKRVAGNRFCLSRSKGRQCIEMETTSMRNISPEYYIQEDDQGHSNFAFAKENIKGKLQLRRADEQ